MLDYAIETIGLLALLAVCLFLAVAVGSYGIRDYPAPSAQEIVANRAHIAGQDTARVITMVRDSSGVWFDMDTTVYIFD